jgi:hypothetical protein
MAALLAVELAPTCKLCNAVFAETVRAEEGSATDAGSSVEDVAFLIAGVQEEPTSDARGSNAGISNSEIRFRRSKSLQKFTLG